MPTTRKPAAKKAATRKPAARKTIPRMTAPKQVVDTTSPSFPTEEDMKRGTVVATISQPVSEAERQAKLTAYTALRGAGLDVPADLAAEVEAWIAEEQQRREVAAIEQAERQKIIDAANAAGPWYVRNGYRTEFSLRLGREKESRRIQLKPRGVPGDMHPLEDGDLKDTTLRMTLQTGLIEVIPAGEADRIAQQQTHNMQPRVHTPTAILRNEKGQPYAPDAIKTTVEFNQQGVVVATLDPNQMQGHVSDKHVQVQRVQSGQPAQQVPQTVSEFVPTGGNPAIIQSGPAPVGGLAPNAQAKIADDLARRKGLQGRPEDVMGLRVTVAPKQAG